MDILMKLLYKNDFTMTFNFHYEFEECRVFQEFLRVIEFLSGFRVNFNL